jgi:hypothetical protein
LFTNDCQKLGAVLAHDVSHRSAHAPEVKQEQSIAPQREIEPRPPTPASSSIAAALTSAARMLTLRGGTLLQRPTPGSWFG